jgi:hypothetical protein
MRKHRRMEELNEDEMDGYLGFAKHALVGEGTGGKRGRIGSAAC